jgi:putative ABC transport system permease protein
MVLTLHSGRLLLAARMAVREMRGGVRGFYVFIACILLGVAAIAGVNAVSAALIEGLAREGKNILGGDLAFTLSLREASPAELAYLQAQGELSRVATMRATVRTQSGEAALVELKAVDAAHPLYGAVVLDPQLPLAQVLPRGSDRPGDIYGGAADPALLARLGIAVGEQLALGAIQIAVRASIDSEPDKLSGGIGFGPRLIISDEALRASALLQPGSVVRWHYRLRLPADKQNEASVRAIAAAAQEKFPQAGWDIRSRSHAAPSLQRNIDRFSQYLTLVGLTALLIGGVGVANAVKAHLDRRRSVVAILKCLGATGGDVVTMYLTQVVGVAAMAAIPGLALGAALPFALNGFDLPLPLAPALYPAALARAFVFGVLVAVAFALWPLGRAHDIPVSALFRDEVAQDWVAPRLRYSVGTAMVIAVVVVLAISTAYDRPIAIIFVIAATSVFVMLRIVAKLIMTAAHRAPHLHSPVIRLAVANLHRPGALTPSIVLSLGLGLALLVTVVAIEGNLRRQFLSALPDQAPSFYFVDIPAGEADKFDAFIRARAPGAVLNRVPMLRGRIVAANGMPADEIKPAPDVAWALQSDRGITFADALSAGSQLVEGEWWLPGYAGPPLVSFEKRIAEGLGLKLQDSVTVNVLGRNMVAKIANLRSVEWQSLGINFVMVFSPNTFRGAPVTDIATLFYPEASTRAQEGVLMRAVAQEFPAVSVLRVRDLLDAVGHTVTNLIYGVRGASALTLLLAACVLAGALAASQRQRIYDATILKTLGATRMRLLLAYALEFLASGAAAAGFGIMAGVAAAAFVVTRLMHLPFVFIPGPLLATCAVGIVSAVVLGLIGTFRALGQKPGPILRNL